jgi:hypothetical protein
LRFQQLRFNFRFGRHPGATLSDKYYNR